MSKKNLVLMTVMLACAGSASAQSAPQTLESAFQQAKTYRKYTLEERLNKELERLYADDIAVRCDAVEQIKRIASEDLVRGRKWIKNQAAAQSGSDALEVSERLKEALDALPMPKILSASLKIVGEPKVGEEIQVSLRIENIGEGTVVAVKALNGFVDSRFPSYDISVKDGSGRDVDQAVDENRRGTGALLVLRSNDFVALEPGADFNALNGDSAHVPLWHVHGQPWKPEKPGHYKIKVVVNYAEPRLEIPNYLDRHEKAALEAFGKRLPMQKFEAEAEVEVKP
ncbi:MAG: hypothetical protein HY077_18800 [Elusimicrobia bacterium]|nr:hypothetical protein [Elusimicrobiota bacterium]